MGEWVDGRLCSWLRVFDVFRTFVCWTHVLTALSRPLLLLYTSFAVGTSVILGVHGEWVDRFVGVTDVLRSVVLL